MLEKNLMDQIIKYAQKQPELSAVYRGYVPGRQGEVLFFIGSKSYVKALSPEIAKLEIALSDLTGRDIPLVRFQETFFNSERLPHFGERVWHRDGFSQSS